MVVQIASDINVFADTYTYFPLTDAQCALPRSASAGIARRTGSTAYYRHTLYSHYYTPNSHDVRLPAWSGFRLAYGPQPASRRGQYVLFVDGSVHFVKNSINLAAWLGIATIAGGEVVELGFLLTGGDTDVKAIVFDPHGVL